MIVNTELCFICGVFSEFAIIDNAVLLREAQCSSCGSSLRNSDTARMIAKCSIDKEIPLNNCLNLIREANIHILEAQASGPIHDVLKFLPNYTCFEYFDHIKPGEYYNGILSNNLMDLSFGDHSFDIVITQDVMEHIPKPELALQQINRVLKQGGYHVFSVPLHEASVTKSRRDLRSVYHGDPLRVEGSLVHTDWGNDIEQIVDTYGMRTVRYDLHMFYQADEITEVDNNYLEYLSKPPLEYYRYNSVVFTSQKEYHLYIKNVEGSVLRLLRYGPDYVTEGTNFNVQPNGESALWAEAENSSKTTVIIMDDIELDSYSDIDNHLVTAKVPDWLFKYAGEHTINLYDKSTKKTSNKLKFIVGKSDNDGVLRDKDSVINNLQQENLELHRQLDKLKNKSTPKFEGWNMITYHELPWVDNYQWSTFRKSSTDIKRIFNFGLRDDIGIDVNNVDTLLWRHWVVAFAVRYALEFKHSHNLKIDMIECGVGDGMSAFFALREITDFSLNNKPFDYTMHLYDSWDSIRYEDLTEEELIIEGRYQNNSFKRVQSNLQEFESNLVYHKGYIPQTLTGNSNLENLYYVHIDLNSAKATLDALEYCYPHLKEGAVILFDDYGWDGFSDTKEVIDHFFKEKPGLLLKFPTGQAIFYCK